MALGSLSVSRFVEHLTDAWSELWNGGDARSAAMVYAPDVVFWNVGRGPGAEVSGTDALIGERFAFLARADRLGVLVRRAVVDDGLAVVEFVIAADECGAPVAAPGCAWWWFDDNGRIAREEWWFDRERWAPADPAVAGHDVESRADDPGPVARRELAEGVVRALDASPAAAVARFWAHDAVVDLMGGDFAAGREVVLRGRTALRDAAAREAADLVGCATTVLSVGGAGPVVAWTQVTEGTTPSGTRRAVPSARVCTLDLHGRIAGEHRYVLRAWPDRAPR